MRHTVRALSVVLALSLIATPAQPCSRVLWAPANGMVFVGRTNDWTERMNSSFRVFPRGIDRVGAVAENPHRWTSKYCSVALT
jgi:choloylglycine hydrolase